MQVELMVMEVLFERPLSEIGSKRIIDKIMLDSNEWKASRFNEWNSGGLGRAIGSTMADSKAPRAGVFPVV